MSQTDLPDAKLVRAAQNGSFDAFRMIVKRYSNALLSVAYGVSGDFHEAQDIAQEAFAKCYRRLHEIRDPHRLGSWLYTICRRTALDFMRTKRSSIPYDDAVLAEADHVSSMLERQIMQSSVRTALSTLDEKSQTAVMLFYAGGWPYQEIALFLDLSVSAVQSRVQRAKHKLKQLLQSDFAAYFRQLDHNGNWTQSVAVHILRRAGHFYIPATNKQRTTAWFIRHFQLQTDRQHHLLLATGQRIYILECARRPEVVTSGIPLLTFTAEQIGILRKRLHQNGVIVGPIEQWGKRYSFCFYDPDDNIYMVTENHSDQSDEFGARRASI